MALENRIDDGFSITITFGDFPNVEFYEKEVQIPGFMMGGPIITSTMRNTKYVTKSAKALLDIPDNNCKVSFTSDAFATTNVHDMMGVNQLITYNLPDGATYALYGFVDEFMPDPFVIGEQPSANLRICHTLTHPTTKVETAPVFTAAP